MATPTFCKTCAHYAEDVRLCAWRLRAKPYRGQGDPPMPFWVALDPIKGVHVLPTDGASCPCYEAKP